MPQDLQGLATFPGIRQVVSCSYTLVHSVTPGIASLQCAPQRDFPALGGTLTFTYGKLVLPFPGCRVVTQSIQRNSSGLIWSLSIQDRRWAWNAGNGSGGPLTGSYNVRLDDDSLDPDRKATPQQLADLCLRAMGETGYDVSQMPNNNYPLVQWAGDNPAQELARLAEMEGCRVVLRLDNTVQIARTGVGLPLPDPILFGAMENTLSINPPQRPDALLVQGGPSRYQADFVLEAVGLDTDGTWQLLSNLSYKPAGGWTRESPPDFLNVSKTPATNGQIPRELAKQTVWRCYRIAVDTLAKGITIPGYGPIAKLRQLLPIEDEQVAVFLSNDGKVQNLPAHVIGKYYDGQETFQNTPDNTPVRKPFTIDREHGIVRFNDCIFLYDAPDADGSLTHVDATLKLRTAVHIRNITTWAWERFQWLLVYPGGQWGTGPRVLKHDELVYLSLPVYSYDLAEAQKEQAAPPMQQGQGVPTVSKGVPAGTSYQYFTLYMSSGLPYQPPANYPPPYVLQPGEPQNPELGQPPPLPNNVPLLLNNLAAIIPEANYYLQAADLEYQTPLPQEITYAGLLPISPDGAIQQVTWSVSSSSGAVTKASRNNEFSFTTTPYKERRLWEELRGGQIQNLKRLAAKLADAPDGVPLA